MLSAVQAYGGVGVTGHAEIVLLVIVACGCLFALSGLRASLQP